VKHSTAMHAQRSPMVYSGRVCTVVSQIPNSNCRHWLHKTSEGVDGVLAPGVASHWAGRYTPKLLFSGDVRRFRWHSVSYRALVGLKVFVELKDFSSSRFVAKHGVAAEFVESCRKGGCCGSMVG